VVGLCFFLLLMGGVIVLVQAAGENVNMSIYIDVPDPQMTIQLEGVDSRDIRITWNWDYIMPGYVPPPAIPDGVLVELSTDGVNFGDPHLHVPSDWETVYLTNPDGMYTARLTIPGVSPFGFIIGPVYINWGGHDDPPPDPTSDVRVSGLAYPDNSGLTVVHWDYEGSSVFDINTNSDGEFYQETTVVPIGVATFTFTVTDPDGRVSAPVTSLQDVPATNPLIVDNIFMPPTIELSNESPTQGEIIYVRGYAYKNADVTVFFDGADSFSLPVTANVNGFWELELDTLTFVTGAYEVDAIATSENGQIISPLSETLFLNNGDPLGSAPVCGDGIREGGEVCDDGCISTGVPEGCDEFPLDDGDGCSSTCGLEGALPTSEILQPDPALFTEDPVTLEYTASSPNGAIAQVQIYYSRNGGTFELYNVGFIGSPAELNGLPDGDYEVYSIAIDEFAFEELPPLAADAVFTIDQYAQYNILAKPEGRADANWGVPAVLTSYRMDGPGDVSIYGVTLDEQGREEIDATAVDPGSYEYVLKGLSHLSKSLGPLAFVGTDLFLDFTYSNTFNLIAGDVHSSKDDYINGLDFSSITLAMYTDDLDADLNYDGLVNGIDLAMPFGNVYGDGWSEVPPEFEGGQPFGGEYTQ